MKKTLGGDRLGSGRKMQVNLHGYERSTHDLGYIWRSTMAAGTLVPFLCKVALPGDTHDIDLDSHILTHPTLGPLFGSFKAQYDVFQAPIRLYQGQLHNNKLGIGMNMSAVKLPLMTLQMKAIDPEVVPDVDNAQINPSCLLAYIGIRGVGITDEETATRDFNGIALLAYWDIYKNYYANKQEEIGAVIHNTLPASSTTVGSIEINDVALPGTGAQEMTVGTVIKVNYVGTPPVFTDVMIYLTEGEPLSLTDVTFSWEDNGVDLITIQYNWQDLGTRYATNWGYRVPDNIVQIEPRVETFPLANIDEMRERILAHSINPAAFNINAVNLTPYSWVLGVAGEFPNMLNTQEGLGIKTYQSDLFNNWLSTEWIDGAGGISEVTAIDTSGGDFTIDTLNLSKKVYDMLNRIMVSGGSYDDWMDAVWAHDRYTRCESPMYMGGMIKELVFQEVVSNSEAEGSGGTQPLGTLAGKGVLSKKHKGGKITIKVDEPSYIIGIVSLTPRIDYSQGNEWDVNLKTMDDFHKPALDEIGFQELITEQMAWWSTEWDGTTLTQRSAGKQPAWINYMTSVNRTFGNFAIQSNEMFMTLNRRYEFDTVTQGIKDLTTYIDPVKYNNIFAQTSLDAQNFWVQIAVDITARRKMSAKIMPNL